MHSTAINLFLYYIYSEIERCCSGNFFHLSLNDCLQQLQALINGFAQTTIDHYTQSTVIVLAVGSLLLLLQVPLWTVLWTVRWVEASLLPSLQSAAARGRLHTGNQIMTTVDEACSSSKMQYSRANTGQRKTYINLYIYIMFPVTD